MRDHDSALSVPALLEQIEHICRPNTLDAYREGLSLARHAVKIAAPGSYEALAANGFLAVLAGNHSFWKESEQHANTFLALYPTYPEAESLHPWVVHALANVCRHNKRRNRACSLLRAALPAASGEIAERMRLTLCWTLCEAGKLKEAKAELPAALEYMSPYHLDLARARLAIAQGFWQESEKDIQSLIDQMTSSPLYDRLDVKMTCDLLQHAADHAGDQAKANYWRKTGNDLTILSKEESLSHLLPSLKTGGGECCDCPDSPAGPRPAGYDRPGTLGTVG